MGIHMMYTAIDYASGAARRRAAAAAIVCALACLALARLAMP